LSLRIWWITLFHTNWIHWNLKEIQNSKRNKILSTPFSIEGGNIIENKIESVSKIIGSQKLNEIFLENPKNVTDQKSSNDFQISRH